MTFADLRLPCEHGRYEYHVEPLCKHGKTHMHASSEWGCAGPDHCSGGRSATIEDLIGALTDQGFAIRHTIEPLAFEGDFLDEAYSVYPKTHSGDYWLIPSGVTAEEE